MCDPTTPAAREQKTEKRNDNARIHPATELGGIKTAVRTVKLLMSQKSTPFTNFEQLPAAARIPVVSTINNGIMFNRVTGKLNSEIQLL